MSFPWDLNIVWFFLIGILLTGYAILDGFDLGVGMLHLAARGDRERRTLLNAIGPVWDGNEVWLVTAGGALFAAFPEVYATVFSGFYVAFMMLLAALIFRAVSIEFRSKLQAVWWRQLWDVSFSGASGLASFLFGVTLGNIARGVPLAADHEFAGSFWGLLNPYALLVGVTTVALFVMHGGLYLALNTEGALLVGVRRWARRAFCLFLLCYIATTVITIFQLPHMTAYLKEQPWLLVLPGFVVLAIACAGKDIAWKEDVGAFGASCAVIAGLLLLFGVGIFPNLVLSSPHPEHSLTIYNAASSPKTHAIMLTIALIGMPLVLCYTAFVYRIFRGKVKLEPESY